MVEVCWGQRMGSNWHDTQFDPESIEQNSEGTQNTVEKPVDEVEPMPEASEDPAAPSPTADEAEMP